MKNLPLLFVLLTLSACGLLPPAPTVTPTPTNTPTATITPSPTATFTPTPAIPKTFEAAPETITATLPPDEEGGQAREVELTKGNISTVFDNLVIYRDADNNAQMVMVLGTGEVKDLRQAGIAELDLTTGEKLEMRLFDSIESAHEYILANSFRMVGDSWGMYEETYPEILEPAYRSIDIQKLVIGITGEQNGFSIEVPNKKEQIFFYHLGVRVLEDGRAMLTIIKKDMTYEFFLLDNKAVENDNKVVKNSDSWDIVLKILSKISKLNEQFKE